MAAVRDSQRSKVYAWETIASKQRRFVRENAPGANSIFQAEFETLAQCEDFLRGVWSTERGRYGRAGVAMPTVERPSWGQRRAYAHHDHRITLPRHTRSRWVILHEAAHLLNPGREAHGPRFVGILIGLLARHAGYEAEELLASAAEQGVRVDARSVGAVPQATLSERLLRLLPVEEMEAAIELGVSWRRVRGAALQLQRRGLARWHRGRLVLLSDLAARASVATPVQSAVAPPAVRTDWRQPYDDAGIDIERAPDGGFNVWPPSWVEDDPYDGDHFAQTRSAAIVMAKTYLAMSQPGSQPEMMTP